jgi:hypothetical protein
MGQHLHFKRCATREERPSQRSMGAAEEDNNAS